MRITQFLLLLSLFFGQTLIANNPNDPLTMPRITNTQDLSCLLAPPTALDVDYVGPEWVKLTWPAVSGASQYRIQVIESNTGNPVSTTFMPGNSTSAQVSTAGAAGDCYARIWSVCSDGSWDVQKSIGSPVFAPIILEIVVNGFQYPLYPVVEPPNVGVELSNGKTYPWNSNQTGFLISYGSKKCSFTLNVEYSQSTGSDVTRVRIGSQDYVDGHFEFSVLGGSVLRIRYANTSHLPVVFTNLGVLGVAHSPTTPNSPGYFYFTAQPASGCVVQKMIPGPPPALQAGFGKTQLESDERTQIAESPRQLTVSPNPFNDQFTVQLPETAIQNGASLHLYDLTGAVSQCYQTAPGQHELTLFTNNIAPGMYLLRLDAGDYTETLKLVKTQ